MSFSFGFGFPFIDNGVQYDSSAQALFDYVGDVPDVTKPHFNNLILAFKASGVWDNANFWCILCVPSLNAFNTLVEIKSLTIASSFNSASVGPPYNTALAEIPTFAGYKFTNGFIKTGFIPSAKMTLNDSCNGVFLFSDESAAATFNFGALNGIGQSTAFSTKLNTNAMVGDAYSTTVGTGRVSVASASGAKGYYYVNRTSATFAEIVQNGVSAGNITATNGALATIENHLNGFNNAGTNANKRNQSPISGWFSLGSGITLIQKSILNPAFNTFLNVMERLAGLHTKQVVLDGNSHAVYWMAKMDRTVQYNLIIQGWKFDNVGVSGQTTTQMAADYASQVAPKFDAALTKNILILVEGTNAMWVDGKTKDQAISDMAALVTSAQATGWTVGVKKQFCRINPSGGAGLVTYPNATAWNTAVSDYNIDVDNGLTGADFVIDVSSNHFVSKAGINPNTGLPFANDTEYNSFVTALITNTTNFHDTTHLTELGYKVEGDINTAAILLQ